MSARTMEKRLGALALLGVTFGLGAIACGNDAPPPPPAHAATNASAAKPGGSAAAAADGGSGATVHATEYAENDFVENDRNRDPFRSFATLFVETKQTTSRRTELAVILPQYSLDELKLMGIVTGGDYPRAMLVDPTSKGWVVKHGDFIGRPDVVHTGGANGADYQLYWRVDRVRDGDIVLIREDPAQPNIAPATRIIPLHAEGENKDREALDAPSNDNGSGMSVNAEKAKRPNE